MKSTLEIWWDFSSPYAYLGATQAEALAARTGAELVWRPMLLGGLFRAIGQADAPVLTWGEQKRAYVFQDLEDWAAFHGVPFKFPSRFPTSSIKALRCYLALPDERRKAFRDATLRAYWAEDRDIADDAVLRGLIGDGADEVLARTQTADVKQALVEATKQAERLGVFGAPTWIVRREGHEGHKLFWGQDRIPLVERALTSKG